MRLNELLSMYNNAKGKYKSLLLELEELRELGGLPHRGESLGIPTQRSNSSSVENYVIRIDELERRLDETNNKMLLIRDSISLFINQIEDAQERSIVELCIFRNTRLPDWKKIARKVCYSETHTRRLYKKGFESIEDIDMEVNL